MIENNYIYIIPLSPTEKDYDIDPVNKKEWTNAEKDSSNLLNHYTDYIGYNKKIDFNGYEWFITYRKYQTISSALFIFTCLDIDYKADEFDVSKKILLKYKNEVGVFGLGSYKRFLLKIFKDDVNLSTEKNEFDLLFSEKIRGNELHKVEESYFLLKIKFDDELTGNIKRDIILLLFLSYITHPMYIQFLNKNKKIKEQDVIKAFWGFKFYLLDSPASQIFPVFFRNNISVIDNLLDHRYMGLVDTQNHLLKDIHLVESGILCLTFFVILDVVFTISMEIIEPLGESIGWETKPLNLVLIPLVFAITFAIISATVFLMYLIKNSKIVNCVMSIFKHRIKAK